LFNFFRGKKSVKKKHLFLKKTRKLLVINNKLKNKQYSVIFNILLKKLVQKKKIRNGKVVYKVLISKKLRRKSRINKKRRSKLAKARKPKLKIVKLLKY